MTYELYDGLEIGDRETAPTREQIAMINDIAVMWQMLSDATDIEISIKTQLEFYTRDDELKGRRIAALIHWRICAKNIRNRINEVKAAKGRMDG